MLEANKLNDNAAIRKGSKQMLPPSLIIDQELETIRDELRMKEETHLHDSTKHELLRQAKLKRNLCMGLSSLPEPKNEYEVTVCPAPEEKIEEDMSERKACERVEEEARQQVLLTKRSKMLQRELPQPTAASIELIRHRFIRADEDKSSFIPATDFELADEMVRRACWSMIMRSIHLVRRRKGRELSVVLTVYLSLRNMKKRC